MSLGTTPSTTLQSSVSLDSADTGHVNAATVGEGMRTQGQGHQRHVSGDRQSAHSGHSGQENGSWAAFGDEDDQSESLFFFVQCLLGGGYILVLIAGFGNP